MSLPRRETPHKKSIGNVSTLNVNTGSEYRMQSRASLGKQYREPGSPSKANSLLDSFDFTKDISVSSGAGGGGGINSQFNSNL